VTVFPPFPGWPGPIYPNRRPGIPDVALPALPAYPSNGAPMAAGAPPLAGMAAYGVPIVYSPDGRPVLRSGTPGGSLNMPPDLPGMPRMPPPPDQLFTGPQTSGLFQPVPPLTAGAEQTKKGTA